MIEAFSSKRSDGTRYDHSAERTTSSTGARRWNPIDFTSFTVSPLQSTPTPYSTILYPQPPALFRGSFDVNPSGMDTAPNIVTMTTTLKRKTIFRIGINDKLKYSFRAKNHANIIFRVISHDFAICGTVVMRRRFPMRGPMI